MKMIHMSKSNNVTCATINKELKQLGYDERAIQGKGYVYFAKGDSHTWKTSNSNVFKANHLTLQQWITLFKELKHEQS